MTAVSRVEELSARYVVQREPALVGAFELIATAPSGAAMLRGLVLLLAVQGKLVPQFSQDELAETLLLRLSERRGPIGRAMSGPVATNAPYGLPVGWAWATLGDLVENMGSGWSPACDEGERSNVDRWAVLRTTAVQVMEYRPKEHKVLPSKLAPRPGIEVKGGDILVTRAGPMNRVGISCAVSETPARLMLSDKIVRAHPIGDEMLASFVVLALNAGWSKELIEIAKTGMAASQVNISQADLKAIPVPVCSRAEQHRIVARVEELMKLCDALEQSGRLADEQHARLTSTLFDALAASESAHALVENWQRIAKHFDLLLDRPEAIDSLEQTILQLAVRGLLVAQDSRDEPASELLDRIRAGRRVAAVEGLDKRERSSKEAESIDRAFDVPHGWSWVRLNQIADSRLGKMLDKAKNTGSMRPYLRNTNVQWRRFELDDVKSLRLEPHELDEYRLRYGDLLVCEGGQPGRCAIWRDTEAEMYFQKAIHRVRPLGGVTAEFVELCLEQDAKSGGLDKYFTGATIKHFVGQELKRYVLPLPPVLEQHRIVARVEELRRLCAQLRERLTEARRTQSQLADALVAEVG